jgi:hypothetical protein
MAHVHTTRTLTVSHDQFLSADIEWAGHSDLRCHEGGGRVSSFIFPYSIIKKLVVRRKDHHLFCLFLQKFHDGGVKYSKWHDQPDTVQHGTKGFSLYSTPIGRDRLFPWPFGRSVHPCSQSNPTVIVNERQVTLPVSIFASRAHVRKPWPTWVNWSTCPQTKLEWLRYKYPWPGTPILRATTP